MSEHTLDTAAVDNLATTFGGRIVLPGDDGYDEARHVWNGLYDRHPALIARCTSAADVVAAVRLRARQRACRSPCAAAATRAVGYGTCDDGIVIDLVADEQRSRSTRTRAPRAPAAARRGASSTRRRRSTASPSPAAASPPPASPA